MARDPMKTQEDPRHLSLVTYRRDGREVATPVWCAALDGKLYVGTTSATGKAKRLRHTPAVRYAPCDSRGRTILGPWHSGTARVVEPYETRLRAAQALRRKYGLIYPLIMVVYWLRGQYSKRILLEIEPGAGGDAP